MEKHTIGGLKKILTTAPEFYDIADYFLTLTETNIAAIQGKTGKNKPLKQMILLALAPMSLMQGIIQPGEQIVLVNFWMMEVPTRYFWHGSALVGGKYIMTFFYFADLDKGLVSLSKGSNTYFARVTVKGVSKTTDPTEAFSNN